MHHIIPKNIIAIMVLLTSVSTYGSEGGTVNLFAPPQQNSILYCMEGTCQLNGVEWSIYCSASGFMNACSELHQQLKSRIYAAIIKIANKKYSKEIADEVIDVLCHNKPYKKVDTTTESHDKYGNVIKTGLMSEIKDSGESTILGYATVQSHICISSMNFNGSHETPRVVHGKINVASTPNFSYIVESLKQIHFTEVGIEDFYLKFIEELGK